MQIARPVGQGAAARKYDILSALAVHALAHDKNRQRQVLRLMSLITTRYNWQRDELAMGQNEIARLWSVDTRTVKREMARFRSQGWLKVKRQGVRGRVSLYGLNLDQLMKETRSSWTSIGPDFVERFAPSAADEKKSDNVVPLRSVLAPATDGSLWSEIQATIHKEDPSTYAVWIRQLTEIGREGGELSLAAPSQFHATYVETHLAGRLLAIARRIDPSLRAVRLS